MRALVDAAIAVSIALMPVAGTAGAAKRTHKSHPIGVSRTIHNAPASSVGNAAAEGNNANSMSGSNSAVENPIGRSNCC